MNMVPEMNDTETWTPTGLPDWVPVGTARYLAHTEWGLPIRQLARDAQCHASTILRQIRKVEMRRDDPLVDAGLRALGTLHRPARAADAVPTEAAAPEIVPDQQTLTLEATRVLRRLCETGALLAVAAEMERAVVVRDAGSNAPTRTAVLSTAVAQALALKSWIAPGNSGRIVRYHITAQGRSALAKMIDKQGGAPVTAGFAEAQGQFVTEAEDDPNAPQRARMRYCLADSPLIALARRRDRDGSAFLSDPLVHAGERLREDFELAQMGTAVTQNWDGFLTAGTSRGRGARGGDAASEARARVSAALGYLGSGLSDVALHCCCYLEGLETTEKRLGWSARSGKIVLRIALMRLQRHYEETEGASGPMIG
ncbi:DUF6456 domain-containing protein [uncultured Sulfitobacter sp.]|uniref:DUF6456 domain-containing protein n=1 Tax=uncultured Sulfitobacter sp. TaxID=191468 RepID=UPI002633B0AA|nr:DUF6456 domain-containing protein [uncultured Sulfitobacter sp.]